MGSGNIFYVLCDVSWVQAKVESVPMNTQSRRGVNRACTSFQYITAMCMVIVNHCTHVFGDCPDGRNHNIAQPPNPAKFPFKPQCDVCCIAAG